MTAERLTNGRLKRPFWSVPSIGAVRMVLEQIETARETDIGSKSPLPTMAPNSTASDVLPALRGEVGLHAGVLQQAIQMYCGHFIENHFKYSSPAARRGQRLKEIKWFRGEVESPITFQDCCDVLGLDRDATWKRIQENPEAVLGGFSSKQRTRVDRRKDVQE